MKILQQILADSPPDMQKNAQKGKSPSFVALITIQTMKQIAAQTDPNEVLIEKGGLCFKAAQ